MNNVRVAIQSRGRMADSSINFLYSLGLKFQPNGRNCLTTCGNYNLNILFLRDDDIPKYVERGAADFGIVGENVILEQNARVKTLKKLGFSFCSLVIAVPEESNTQNLEELQNARIATSYPNLLGVYLKEQDLDADILTLKGSVEIVPSLNLADAICDLKQTGKTLAENNLRAIATILESQAVLIQSPFLTQRKVGDFEDLVGRKIPTFAEMVEGQKTLWSQNPGTKNR